MPAERNPGMDNPYYDWSPITTRPRLTWPNNARVALCVIVSVEHYPWKATNDFSTGGLPEVLPPHSYKSPDLPGGVSGVGRPFPDIISYSQREYGNRVGIFRVMKILDKYGIRATAAIDASIADNYPCLIQQCQQRGWEFIAHGMAVNQMITTRMDEETERAYIKQSIESVARASGSRPLGWLGPEYGESTLTPSILAGEGIRYVCDWPNDDQPYPMKTQTGKIYSLPVILDLDDTFTHWMKRVPINIYAKMVTDTFDILYREGAETGRLMVINIHPWLMGQPFRSKYLDQALGHICERDGVFKATGSEIIDWYQRQVTEA